MDNTSWALTERRAGAAAAVKAMLVSAPAAPKGRCSIAQCRLQEGHRLGGSAAVFLAPLKAKGLSVVQTALTATGAAIQVSQQVHLLANRSHAFLDVLPAHKSSGMAVFDQGAAAD